MSFVTKVKKLYKNPMAFAIDWLGCRGIHVKFRRRPNFKKMILLEKISLDSHEVSIHGRLVGGFHLLNLDLSEIVAVGSNGKEYNVNSEYRFDLKNYGFLIKIPVSDINDKFKLSFHIESINKKCGIVKDNIRFFRLKSPILLEDKFLSVSDMAFDKWRINFSLKKKRVPISILITSMVKSIFTRYFFVKILYLVTRNKFKNRKIVIISERRDTAQDNSMHLFNYISNIDSDHEFYYLIERSSSGVNNIFNKSNVIYFDTLSHLLYLVHAKLLVNSYDIESYMLPTYLNKHDFTKHMYGIVNYKKVFLQHGVTYNDVSKSIHAYNTGYDYIFCTGQEEKLYLSFCCGYGERAVLTGFPRFDNLKVSNQLDDFILLMPTWRRGLSKASYNNYSSFDIDKETAKFINSDYYKFYNEILSSSALNEKLKKNNLKIKFYPHYEMQKFLKCFKFDSDVVSVIGYEDENVQELLIKCRALITDYSSVFFDVAYMKKPILYTNFDEEEFYKKQYRKGYFDLSDNGFGVTCPTSESVMENIGKIIDENFIMNATFSERVDDFFPFIDKNNCHRVYSFLEKEILHS